MVCFGLQLGLQGLTLGENKFEYFKVGHSRHLFLQTHIVNSKRLVEIMDL